MANLKQKLDVIGAVQRADIYMTWNSNSREFEFRCQGKKVATATSPGELVLEGNYTPREIALMGITSPIKVNLRAK